MFRFGRSHIPRLYLLPARDVPKVLVLIRHDRDLWQTARYDALSGQLEVGDRLHACLYVRCCDVSWDGNWFLYLAFDASRDHRHAVWTGLTEVPHFRDVARWPATYTFGGGAFTAPNKLAVETNEPEACLHLGDHPFELSHRLACAGYWRRRDDCELKLTRQGYRRIGLDWMSQHAGMPNLYARELATDDYTSPRWVYQVQGYPELLAHGVTSACQVSGQLLVARRGHLEAYAPAELAGGVPGVRISFEKLGQPARSA